MDDDVFYVLVYDEFMRPRSIHDGFSCRGRPTEAVMYLADYWGLSEGLMKVLSFQEYCTLEIHNLFIYPYCGTNKERLHTWLMKCARKWVLDGCHLEPKEDPKGKIHQIHLLVQAVGEFLVSLQINFSRDMS